MTSSEVVRTRHHIRRFLHKSLVPKIKPNTVQTASRIEPRLILNSTLRYFFAGFVSVSRARRQKAASTFFIFISFIYPLSLHCTPSQISANFPFFVSASASVSASARVRCRHSRSRVRSSGGNTVAAAVLAADPAPETLPSSSVPYRGDGRRSLRSGACEIVRHILMVGPSQVLNVSTTHSRGQYINTYIYSHRKETNDPNTKLK